MLRPLVLAENDRPRTEKYHRIGPRAPIPHFRSEFADVGRGHRIHGAVAENRPLITCEDASVLREVRPSQLRFATGAPRDHEAEKARVTRGRQVWRRAAGGHGPIRATDLPRCGGSPDGASRVPGHCAAIDVELSVREAPKTDETRGTEWRLANGCCLRPRATGGDRAIFIAHLADGTRAPALAAPCGRHRTAIRIGDAMFEAPLLNEAHGAIWLGWRRCRGRKRHRATREYSTIRMALLAHGRPPKLTTAIAEHCAAIEIGRVGL
mmetsp:Transcript_101002/g.290605  ORF Transcript_101002/g.290605 Transcript_101002/m.290605 type:complete len:266 (-) Transcript_101002:389-1186(-)